MSRQLRLMVCVVLVFSEQFPVVISDSPKKLPQPLSPLRDHDDERYDQLPVSPNERFRYYSFSDTDKSKQASYHQPSYKVRPAPERREDTEFFSKDPFEVPSLTAIARMMTGEHTSGDKYVGSLSNGGPGTGPASRDSQSHRYGSSYEGNRDQPSSEIGISYRGGWTSSVGGGGGVDHASSCSGCSSSYRPPGRPPIQGNDRDPPGNSHSHSHHHNHGQYGRPGGGYLPPHKPAQTPGTGWPGSGSSYERPGGHSGGGGVDHDSSCSGCSSSYRPPGRPPIQGNDRDPPGNSHSHSHHHNHGQYGKPGSGYLPPHKPAYTPGTGWPGSGSYGSSYERPGGHGGTNLWSFDPNFHGPPPTTTTTTTTTPKPYTPRYLSSSEEKYRPIRYPNGHSGSTGHHGWGLSTSDNDYNDQQRPSRPREDSGFRNPRPRPHVPPPSDDSHHNNNGGSAYKPPGDSSSSWPGKATWVDNDRHDKAGSIPDGPPTGSSFGSTSGWSNPPAPPPTHDNDPPTTGSDWSSEPDKDNTKPSPNHHDESSPSPFRPIHGWSKERDREQQHQPPTHNEPRPPPPTGNGQGWSPPPPPPPPSSTNGWNSLESSNPPSSTNGWNSLESSKPPSSTNGWNSFENSKPPSSTNGWNSFENSKPPSSTNGWNSLESSKPPSSTNGWNSFENSKPPSSTNGWNSLESSKPPSSTNGWSKPPSSSSATPSHKPTSSPNGWSNGWSPKLPPPLPPIGNGGWSSSNERYPRTTRGPFQVNLETEDFMKHVKYKDNHHHQDYPPGYGWIGKGYSKSDPWAPKDEDDDKPDRPGVFRLVPYGPPPDHTPVSGTGWSKNDDSQNAQSQSLEATTLRVTTTTLQYQPDLPEYHIPPSDENQENAKDKSNKDKPSSESSPNDVDNHSAPGGGTGDRKNRHLGRARFDEHGFQYIPWDANKKRNVKQPSIFKTKDIYDKYDYDEQGSKWEETSATKSRSRTDNNGIALWKTGTAISQKGDQPEANEPESESVWTYESVDTASQICPNGRVYNNTLKRCVKIATTQKHNSSNREIKLF